jgi:hypothetical protein
MFPGHARHAGMHSQAAAVASGSVLLVASVVWVAGRAYRRRRLELLDVWVASVGVLYGGGMLLVMGLGSSPVGFWGSYLNRPPEDVFVLAGLCGLSTAGSVAGWYLGPRLRQAQSDTNPSRDRGLEIGAWILLGSGFVAYWVYALPYGGFSGLLDVSRALRSGFAVADNQWSLLKRFGGFAFFAAFLFFGLLRSPSQGRSAAARSRAAMGLLLALVVALFVLVSWVGRLGIFVFVGTFAAMALLPGGQVRVARIGVCALVLIGAAILFPYVGAAIGANPDGVGHWGVLDRRDLISLRVRVCATGSRRY